jgi:tetratricopeptide (TPR) repeat protein
MPRIVAILVALSATTMAQAQGTSPLVGQRVVIKYKSPLTVGGVVVEPKDYRAFTVEKADGNWLWLVSGGVSGWKARDEVLTLDEAITFYTQEIARNPNAWNAYLYRAFVRDVKHEYDQAIADYSSAIRIYPLWANTFNNRGWTYHKIKEFDKAIADYNAALKLDPGHVLATVNRGLARQDKREYYKAIEDFNRAIKLDPNYGLAHCALAWLYATCPDPKFRDGKLAVQSATKACALTHWRDPAKLAVLAAACAEAGDFAKAQRWQQDANGRYIEPDDRRVGMERLALYRQKKPFRTGAAEDPARHRGHPSEPDRWAQFPDPDRAAQVFAELQERIGPLPNDDSPRDRQAREKRIADAILHLSHKHHLRQREVKAIWQAGTSS